MKVLVTEPRLLAPTVREKLASLGTVTCGPFSRDELKHSAADANVILTRLGHLFDSELLGACSSLQYLVSATTGMDHIDVRAAEAAGVRVITLRDRMDLIEDIPTTAEHTWALLLALIRHVPAAVEHVRRGGWDRDQFWGRQLAGKRIGLIGYGRIGRKVAMYARAFGMHVVATDLDPGRIARPAEAVSLDWLLENSDIVSIHATASPENRNLLDAAVISRLRSGAVLLNTSRGNLVDESAVYDALAKGNLWGYATDVIDGEENGMADRSPIVKAMRQGYPVLVTPHIGGAAAEAIARTETVVVDVLLEEVAGATT